MNSSSSEASYPAREGVGDAISASESFFPRTRQSGETDAQYALALRRMCEGCSFDELVERTLSLQLKLTSNGTCVDPVQTLASASQTATTSRNKTHRPAASAESGREGLEKHQEKSYKKTSGAADGAGERYEVYNLALVFLRLIEARAEFQLASNMDAAGCFDDILVKYRLGSGANHPWYSACVQLKHKQNNSIQKHALLGLSGAFSLVKYCDSYCNMKASVQTDLDYLGKFEHHQFIIFTNAKISDLLTVTRATNNILNTGGGRAIAFEKGGEIYDELCEWAVFKDLLNDLTTDLTQKGEDAEEITAEAVVMKIKNFSFKNIGINSFYNQLLSSPTLGKLDELLKHMKLVRSKECCEEFLGKLLVFTDQTKEEDFGKMLDEVMQKIWKSDCSNETELTQALVRDFIKKIQHWWQKDSYWLCQDSNLWLDIVRSQVKRLSESRVWLLDNVAEFKESSLEILFQAIPRAGILNVRVESLTAASSVKISRALHTFDESSDMVLHVDLAYLLDHEGEVLAAWDTQWCRILVVECEKDLDRDQAARVRAGMVKVVEKDASKLLVLVARADHILNILLENVESYTSFRDNFMWGDLTDRAQENILSAQINLQATWNQLSALIGTNQKFLNNFDFNELSELILGEVTCGLYLGHSIEFFVPRKLTGAGKTIHVNSVHDLDDKLVLVASEPGMGKSTLFTHLAAAAKGTDPSAWVVHIRLNDFTIELAAMESERFTATTARKFLENLLLKPGNHLEKLLFRSMQHKVLLFIDGVDEVCPHYEEKVLMLLRCVKDLNVGRLWIAARPTFKTKLEALLKIPSVTLVEFSRKDQIEFFEKVWKYSFPSISDFIVKSFTEELLNALTTVFGEGIPILGVPLMAFITANGFKDHLRTYGSDGQQKINDKVDVMFLFDLFVKTKFDLYFVEKKMTLNRSNSAIIDDEKSVRQSLLLNYQFVALHLLFTEKEILKMHFKGKNGYRDSLEQCLKNVANGRDKVGIVVNVVNGVPHFVHRTFAEYFAALLLAVNFQENKYFIEEIMFTPAFEFMFDMFNRFLAKDYPLQIAVLNRNLQEAKCLLSQNTPINEVDAGGRTALHLAVFLSGSDCHPVYTELVILLLNCKAKLKIADYVLGWKPLQYVDRMQAWSLAGLILNHGGDVLDMPTIKSINEATREKFTDFIQQPCLKANLPSSELLLGTARDGGLPVVRYLIDECRGNVHCRGLQNETMVHMAAAGNYVTLLKYLVSKGLSLLDEDDDSHDAMHYAEQASADKAVHFLEEQGMKRHMELVPIPEPNNDICVVGEKRGVIEETFAPLGNMVRNFATNTTEALEEVGEVMEKALVPLARNVDNVATQTKKTLEEVGEVINKKALVPLASKVENAASQTNKAVNDAGKEIYENVMVPVANTVENAASHTSEALEEVGEVIFENAVVPIAHTVENVVQFFKSSWF